jgi:hypothetical protein
MNSFVFILLVENSMRIISSAHATNTKKTKQALLRRTFGENHHSFDCQKSDYIVNRLIHCAIGTLVGWMFAELLFFSCYTQKLLSLLYVWDVEVLEAIQNLMGPTLPYPSNAWK